MNINLILDFIREIRISYYNLVNNEKALILLIILSIFTAYYTYSQGVYMMKNNYDLTGMLLICSFGFSILLSVYFFTLYLVVA